MLIFSITYNKGPLVRASLQIAIVSAAAATLSKVGFETRRKHDQPISYARTDITVCLRSETTFRIGQGGMFQKGTSICFSPIFFVGFRVGTDLPFLFGVRHGIPWFGLANLLTSTTSQSPFKILL